ncbi:MAG: ribosome maturation factor RimM [Bacillota bacterium]
MLEYMEVGKIINTHGVRGELKIMPLTDDPGRFEKLKSVYISPKISEEMRKYNIQSVKYQKNFVILKLLEIDDMDTAQGLKEQFVIIDRKDAVKLPKDAYFICDLLGMDVFDESGKQLGVLKDILQTGSNDVYVVRDENKKEILIPALKTVVKDISIDDRKITVNLPQGLIDDEV